MRRWRATTEDELRELDGIVHDAFFEPADACFDAAAGTLTIPFAQEWAVVEDPGEYAAEPVRETWRYREELVPYARGTLRVACVEAVEEEADGARVLLHLFYDAGALTVLVVAGKLVATVTRLDVTVELDRDDVAFRVRRRRGKRIPWVSDRAHDG